MPENVCEEVVKIREQPGIPALTIPPHITVKGTFADPTNLQEVKRIVSEIAADTARFAVEVGDLEVWGRHDERILVVTVTQSPDCSACIDG